MTPRTDWRAGVGRDRREGVRGGAKDSYRPVAINGGAFNPLAPFGGYKQSGIGRERGLYGFEEFLEVKQYSTTNPLGTVSG